MLQNYQDSIKFIIKVQDFFLRLLNPYLFISSQLSIYNKG